MLHNFRTLLLTHWIPIIETKACRFFTKEFTLQPLKIGEFQCHFCELSNFACRFYFGFTKNNGFAKAKKKNRIHEPTDKGGSSRFVTNTINDCES